MLLEGKLAKEIFISYRRSDAAWAGRIYDRLEREFESEGVFMDVESIQAGHVFDTVIGRQAVGSKVMLAIIGSNWLSEEGRQRLGATDDYVRRELIIGLRREGRVIPILIDGTPYLTPDDLPDALQRLASLQAVQITHKGFRADIEEVTRIIRT